MNFRAETCITRVLKHEGGYVNHPDDPGGATNMGITLETFRRYVKPNATATDVKNMTQEQARIVYKRQYWDNVNADLLPIGVDYAVFDYAVNSGPSRSVRHLQSVIGAEVDGVVGPQTLKFVKKKAPKVVIDDLCDRRLAFLRRLGTWNKFGRGWGIRVEEVRDAAKDDVTSKPKEPAPMTETVTPTLWDIIRSWFGRSRK